MQRAGFVPNSTQRTSVKGAPTQGLDGLRQWSGRERGREARQRNEILPRMLFGTPTGDLMIQWIETGIRGVRMEATGTAAAALHAALLGQVMNVDPRQSRLAGEKHQTAEQDLTDERNHGRPASSVCTKPVRQRAWRWRERATTSSIEVTR
jgi:hypothetical protein